MKTEVTINLVQVLPVQVGEITIKGSSTFNNLQVSDVKATQQGVVEDVELTINLGKVRHAQSGQIVVSKDLKRSTSKGEGIKRDGLEGVVTQNERAVDVLQVGDVKGADILNGQVSSRCQVWQLDSGLVVVEGQGQTVSDGLQVRQVNRSNVLVVVDVQDTDGLELQKLVDGTQSSIRQGKGGDVSETRTQVEGNKGRQGNKGQLVTGSKLQELNIVQGSQCSYGQRAGDVSESSQVNGGNGRRIEHVNITLD